MRRELSKPWYSTFYSALYDEIEVQLLASIAKMTIDQENRAHVEILFDTGATVDVYTLSESTIDGWSVPHAHIFLEGRKRAEVLGSIETEDDPESLAYEVARKIKRLV